MVPSVAPRLGRLLLSAAFVLLSPWAIGTTLIPRDVKLTFRKFHAATGIEIWHSQEFLDVRPARVELFPGRVASYFYSLRPASLDFSPFSRPEDSRVYFFDSGSGKEAPAFDTRDFVGTRDDALLAVSSNGYSSMLDERNELYLSNGWKSYGIKFISWDGVRTIRFFQAGRPMNQDPIGTWREVWTWTLPDGVDRIASWQSNILHVRFRMEKDVAIETLVAIKAGNDRPLWKFELPTTVPSVEDEPLPPGKPMMRRGITYAVGEKSIFVFGNGFLFVLDPETGSLKRELEVAAAVALKDVSFKLNWAAVHSAGDSNTVLASDNPETPNLLVNVGWTPTATVQLLRSDLLDGSSVIAHNGSIYCFTAEELPESLRRKAPEL